MIRSTYSRAATCVALLLGLTLPAMAAETSAANAKPAPPAPAAANPLDRLALDSDQQKTLYALGLALSQSLSRLDLQDSELTYLVQGLQDGVLGRDPRVKLDDYADKVQDLAQARMATASAREEAKAKDFLARMAGEKGAVKTDSGIVIISRQEGSGPAPRESDTIRVNYEGKLADGTVFDSSIERGEPATFPLDQVIPCWTEALQHVKVGSRVEIVCPPDLAYGADGRPGIPPNSALVFDVHLLGIGDTTTASPGKGTTAHPPLMQQVARLGLSAGGRGR
jgi:FKBP-type peptidyl-prolyl cis-trans isomerase